VFDSGELRLVLLKLIGDQPRHGYDLIRAIAELTGGAYEPSPGTIYPNLTLLGDMGHIAEDDAVGTRKSYAATQEGAAHLEQRKDEVAALLARLASMAAARQRTDGGPVRRAMGNLRAVLTDKLSGEATKPQTLLDVAAIIDEAAQRIERL
jgi:DNA-binding PadR family transcriptional regulator